MAYIRFMANVPPQEPYKSRFTHGDRGASAMLTMIWEINGMAQKYGFDAPFGRFVDRQVNVYDESLTVGRCQEIIFYEKCREVHVISDRHWCYLASEDEQVLKLFRLALKKIGAPHWLAGV